MTRPSRRRRVTLEALAVVAVLLVAVLSFAGQWQSAQPRTGTGDSFWYMRSAAEFAGASPATAAREAGQVYCADIERAHLLGAERAGCTGYDVVGVPARYQAIFTSRPGYPLAASLLVGPLGLARGMQVTDWVIFLLVALATFAALRISRIGRIGAVTGAAAVCLLPVAYWDSRTLAEGAAQLGVLVAAAGAVALVRRPGWTAAAVLTAAEVVLFATKPAQAAALCVALLAAAGLAALLRMRSRAWPRLGWTWTAVITVAVGGGWWLIGQVLHLPTLTETVQDMATRHFRSPDIADPLAYLLRRSASLWWHLLVAPWPLVVMLAAGAVLVWRARGVGLIWAAAALSAVLVVSAHPLPSEYPRLIATGWLAVAAAAALACDWAVGTLGRGRRGSDRAPVPLARLLAGYGAQQPATDQDPVDRPRFGRPVRR